MEVLTDTTPSFVWNGSPELGDNPNVVLFLFCMSKLESSTLVIEGIMGAGKSTIVRSIEFYSKNTNAM